VDLANESTVEFGSFPVGTSVTVTFTIRNTGTAVLTGSGPVLSGLNDTDFLLTSMPSFPVAAGGSTTFTVRFTPQGTGLRKVSLGMSTNDNDEPGFSLELQGIGSGPGFLDPGFSPAFSGLQARCMATQPDGKIIVGGTFDTVGSASHMNLVRLLPQGGVDASFQASTWDSVECIAVQTDGKIVIGGQFTGVNGVERSYLARLLTDGSLDTGFAPILDSWVSCLEIRPDGGILIGGEFRVVQGMARDSVALLDANGTVNPAFDPSIGHGVSAIRALANGKILVSGGFGTVGGVERQQIARLLPNGTLDTTFVPNVTGGFVNSIVPLSNGKVIIGGSISSVSGQTRINLARLNENGSLDNTFSLNASPNNVVFSLVGQADEKLLASGLFSSVAGVGRQSVARFNSEGTLDSGFDPLVWQTAVAVGLQKDGKVLLAGDFETVGALPQPVFARLENDARTNALTVPSATRVQWLRGGGAPETSLVTFELSTNGQYTWAYLGTGTPISGGWELTGIALPAGGHVRARARVARRHLRWIVRPGGRGGPLRSGPIAGNRSGTAFRCKSGERDDCGLRHGALRWRGHRELHAPQRWSGPLTDLQAVIQGSNAANFALPATVPAQLIGATSTQLTVQFTPTTAGTKSAVLRIASNDSDENPFTVTLTGVALPRKLPRHLRRSASTWDRRPRFRSRLPAANRLPSNGIEVSPAILRHRWGMDRRNSS